MANSSQAWELRSTALESGALPHPGPESDAKQTALLFFHFYPSSSKLANVNNQRKTRTRRHIFLNSFAACCSCQQKQVQLPGPIYVSLGDTATATAADTICSRLLIPPPRFLRQGQFSQLSASQLAT